MKKAVSGIFVAALALVGVIGTTSKAEAALFIDFDNVLFDGGTVTPSAGGNFIGSNIQFDSIFLKDTVLGTMAGVQCGVATTTGTALAADACKLNFNTGTNTFTVNSPTGLWNIGPDFLPFTADRGGLIAGTAGQNVLTGSFVNFQNFGPGPGGNNLFVAAGNDTKNPALLAFFGLPANSTFTFANTEIYAAGDGVVSEADLVNFVNIPEPASMALFGLGLMGFGVVNRRRKANQAK